MKEKIDDLIEFINGRINVERNSYFGKGCITIPIIEADKILEIMKDYRKQSEVVGANSATPTGEWMHHKSTAGGIYDKYRCSVCNHITGWTIKHCPPLRSENERRCGMIMRNALVADTDYENFQYNLATAINDMQEDGLRVDVQYQPLIRHADQLCYTALVIGRLKGGE